MRGPLLPTFEPHGFDELPGTIAGSFGTLSERHRLIDRVFGRCSTVLVSPSLNFADIAGLPRR